MEHALNLLHRQFHMSGFRGLQEPAIASLLKGQDVLLVMPTGSGKSLCYQLPSAMGLGLTVVISPLIALQEDQVKKASALGIKATQINSKVPRIEREDRQRHLSNYELLFATPERFRKPEFVSAVQNAKIAFLAIDEAHCISQWGHDFRPDYSRLGEVRSQLQPRATIAMTATATAAVEQDILRQLKFDPTTANILIGSIERPNLFLAVHPCFGADEKIRAIVGLKARHPGSGIIYFSLISTLYQFSTELKRLGIDHEIYHGDLKPKDKDTAYRRFIEAEDGLILATPAFGLGIDKPNVRLIVHAEVPSALESYYQEVGRAGRDDEKSYCYLLYDADDIAIQMEFQKWANPDPEFLSALFTILKGNLLQFKSQGLDFLRERLNFYNRRDFRVETALNLLERYDVIEWTHRSPASLQILNVELPNELINQELFSNRQTLLQKNLYNMAQYANLKTCRKQFIYRHFGSEKSTPCGFCDVCFEADL